MVTLELGAENESTDLRNEHHAGHPSDRSPGGLDHGLYGWAGEKVMATTKELRSRAVRAFTDELIRIFGPISGWDAHTALHAGALMDHANFRAIYAASSLLAQMVRRDP